jgi:hypothetical protein
MAFPMMMAMQATAYQAFKTATTPFSTGWLNFVTPQTGGQTPSGNPELALPPGPEKEMLQWYSLLRRADSLPLVGQGILQYAQGKANPFTRSVMDFFKSRTMGDWIGKLVTNASPIVMQQPRQRGSALSGAERWFGIRQAPRALSEPASLDQTLDHQLLRDARTAAWRQYYRDQELEQPTGVERPNDAGRSSECSRRQANAAARPITSAGHRAGVDVGHRARASAPGRLRSYTSANSPASTK